MDELVFSPNLVTCLVVQKICLWQPLPSCLTLSASISVTAGPPPPRPWIPLVENFKPTKPTALFTVSFSRIDVRRCRSPQSSLDLSFSGDVLQRAVRPVRDAADVRLLPAVGAQLGVQEEGHSRRSEALQVSALKTTPN